MARRKTQDQPARTGQSKQGLVLMGDVREIPTEVREGGRIFRPVGALWVRAEDGFVVGMRIDEPGRPAQTLVDALRSPIPIPGEPKTPELPSQVVLFNEELARQVKPLLAPLGIEIMISPPFKQFDELFDELSAHLNQLAEKEATLDLPGGVLKLLVTAAERLWRARPWEYAADYPQFALVPNQDGARPLYASILGANEEVFGVALYTSIEDYKATLELGESTLRPWADEMSPSEQDAAAAQALSVLRHRAFLVTFDPKDAVPEGYREQLARAGWSRRQSVVPAFAAMGAGEVPALVTAEEAAEVTTVVDALVAFCQRHRKRIAEEDFPIHDTVEVGQAGKTVRVDVSVPGEDPSAPPASVYRLKVLLKGWGVWRKIDVRSNQTLEDLHYAIQDAFGWDDDHLYAFFMSGKAWDRSTEYVRPEALQPGERSSRIRLDRLGLEPGKRFLYIFDFGDEWRHEIRVEKAGIPDDEGEYPRVVAEHGTPPPQYGDMDEDDEGYEEEEEE